MIVKIKKNSRRAVCYTFFVLSRILIHTQDIRATEIKFHGVYTKTTFGFCNLPVPTFTHSVCNPQLDLIKVGFKHTHTYTYSTLDVRLIRHGVSSLVII